MARTNPMSAPFRAIWRATGEAFEAQREGETVKFWRPGDKDQPWRSLPQRDFDRIFATVPPPGKRHQTSLFAAVNDDRADAIREEQARMYRRAGIL